MKSHFDKNYISFLKKCYLNNVNFSDIVCYIYKAICATSYFKHIAVRKGRKSIEIIEFIEFIEFGNMLIITKRNKRPAKENFTLNIETVYI